MTKWSCVFLLVGCTSVRGAANGNGAIAAPQRTPVIVTRIYTGPDGQAHAQSIERMLTPSDRELAKVSGVFLQRQSAGLVQDWHTASRRQYVITMSGRGEIEIAGGERIPFGPGRILLMEDLTGKGHVYRGLGNDEHISLVIPLAGQ